jgi:ubiquinone/menaquinone biosynthesis C-methylase UbiE
MMNSVAAKRYDRGLWFLEKLSLKRLRRELLRNTEGNILEVGVGTGANLPYYASDRHIIGIDRNPDLLAGAATRVNGRSCPLLCADAQQLPFGDDLFDTIVGTLVFCCISNPDQALGEIRRVLRHDGRLLLLEHVRGQAPISRRLTDWLHPLWFAIQGECHLNRETAAAVEDAGFNIVHISQHGWGVLQLMHARIG